jgi:hypothetical protein
MSALTSGPDDGAHGKLVPTGPPPALRWNLWATAVWCGLSILSNLVLFGERPYLRKSLIDQNAKAKNPVANYTGARVDKDIHSQLVGGLIEVLLVSVILLLLAGLTWRGRRWARWVLFALALVGLPLRVGVLAQLVLGGAPSSAPGIYRATLVLAGFVAVLVAVLLMQRPTREYFAALRETQRGNLPAVPGARVPGSRPGSLGSTGARPAGGGLGALFAPRRRPSPAAQPNPASADTAADDTAAANTAGDDTGSETGSDIATDPTSVDRSAAAAPRRPSATRPGRVKAKGSGTRPGRFKSRQQ